jgi:hypothetical protein
MLERVTVNPEAFMPRGTPMIQGNPFTKGFEHAQSQAAQTEERDLRVETARENALNARTDRANKNAFDAGLASVVSIQDPGQRNQATAELASRTRQSQLALQTLGTEDTRRRSLEDKALTAYSNGQTALGDQYSNQAGVTIPEAIKHDGAMAGAIKLGRDLGYDDPQQAAAFAATYKQTRDVKAATDAAGVPKPKVHQYAPRGRELVNIPDGNGGTAIYSHDPNDGSLKPTGHTGTVTKAGSGSSAANNSLATYEAKFKTWLSIPGRENDREGAALYANGKKQMTWPEARQAAGTMVKSLEGPYGPLYETEEQVSAAVEKFAAQIMGTQSSLSTVTPVPTVGGGGGSDPAKMTDEQLQEWLRQNGGAK